MEIIKKYIVLLAFTLVFASCSNDDEPIRIGLEDPVFQTVSDAWVPSSFQLNMTEIWNFSGINRSGMNYYFLSQV
ncbi:MAG: hypothetical protein AAF363_17375 [Bacteroidota bacterium]